MQQNSSGSYHEKLNTEDSEGDSTTADKKRLTKFNQINKYLKNKIEMHLQT